MGCTVQHKICPAYQSAFIFDKPTERSTFVHYNENKNQPLEILASNSTKLNLPARDSSWDNSVVMKGPALPLERRMPKDRYLLLPKKTYKKALKALQTVNMKPVYPKKEEVDSANIKKLLDSAARSVSDTTLASSAQPKAKEKKKDSVYVISLEKEKFTSDQDNYMWYFRDILLLPDVRMAMLEKKEAKKEKKVEEKKAKRKGLFASLKNLFKKKKKSETDSTSIQKEEENYDVEQLDQQESDSTSTQTEAIGSQSKAAVIKSSKKKEKKKKSSGKNKVDAQPAPPKQEPKKDEGDGF